jgi:hypothetical protein
MSRSRNILTAGAVAVAVIFGKTLLKALPFTAAFFASQSVAGLFNTPEEARDMQAGFEKVAPGEWDAWLTMWKDSTNLTFRKWGARVAAEYTSDEEFITVYRERAHLFESIRDDPTMNRMCSATALSDASLDMARIDVTAVARLMGRNFARHHVGMEPWKPVVDLGIDQDAWADFAQYLDAHGLEIVLDALIDMAEGREVANSHFCSVQATLYQAAADSPNDLIGNVRFIDFMRSVELFGLSA